jgi:hypothetical protein
MPCRTTSQSVRLNTKMLSHFKGQTCVKAVGLTCWRRWQSLCRCWCLASLQVCCVRACHSGLPLCRCVPAGGCLAAGQMRVRLAAAAADPAAATAVHAGRELLVMCRQVALAPATRTASSQTQRAASIDVCVRCLPPENGHSARLARNSRSHRTSGAHLRKRAQRDLFDALLALACPTPQARSRHHSCDHCTTPRCHMMCCGLAHACHQSW